PLALLARRVIVRRQGACYATVELVFFYVKRCALHVLEIALQRLVLQERRRTKTEQRCALRYD
ncbi:MAG: hypothetical protein WBK61_07360, partial [Bacillota bacterium]